MTYEELHLGYLLVDFLHKLYYKIDKLMLEHSLCVEICYEEGNIVSLSEESLSLRYPAVKTKERASLYSTFIGFRRSMKKASARCVKKRMNLCTRICSISSACLILMLTLTLLMLGSMSTRSFSLRATCSGFRRISGDDAASTSGTLCRSAV